MFQAASARQTNASSYEKHSLRGWGRAGQRARQAARIMAAGMQTIHITDLEAAINHWRARSPANGGALAPELAALAQVYGQMAWQRQHEVDAAGLPAAARAAWLAWYAGTPDTPCIAICSTAQGDAVCKGCGRTEHEVQHWPAMSPYAKRAVWRRITREDTAWRFNRYADRVQRPGGGDQN
jgi:hypothetical protein